MQQPGRPREFDPDEMLARIMKLFWEHGYEATGLSDIIAATGVGKASLYAAFGNKQAMYLKALAHYEGIAVDAAVAMLRARDRPPLDRIDAFISAPILAVRDDRDRRGCFLCNAAADRASLDPETDAFVRRSYTKMQAALADALREAFPGLPGSEAASRAQLVLTLYTGLRVMSRAGLESSELALARDAARTLIRAPMASEAD